MKLLVQNIPALADRQPCPFPGRPKKKQQGEFETILQEVLKCEYLEAAKMAKK